MTLLKPAQHYPTMQDPQHQPRYVGLPTFFRVSLHAGSGRGRYRPHRRAVRWRRDESDRRAARAARGAQPVEPAPPLQPGHRRRPVRRGAGARPRRLLDRAAVRAAGRPAGDRGVLPPGRRGRGGAGQRRRRPFDRLADPARGRREPAGRRWCTSTRMATPATTTWDRASTTARRSAGRWMTGCWTRTASSRSVCAAPARPGRDVGVQRAGGDARAADGRAARQGLALGGGGGAPGRRRWPCYISFDIDSLDPVWAPGTGTPEAGG